MLSRRPIWGILFIFVVASLIVIARNSSDIAQAWPNQEIEGFDCTTVSQIPELECLALVALYNGTNGVNWSNNDGWLADNTPCDWFGVRCNSEDRVSQLFLDQNGLDGPIPSELGDLSQLTWLQLNGNQLQGTIPAALGHLTQVTFLRLELNQLSGPIPPELGNMTALESLTLSDNPLNAAIPPELAQLSNLKELKLSYSELRGAVPPELGNLSALEVLGLDNNPALNGPLPLTFINLTNLTFFHFLETDLCEPTDAAFQAWLSGVQDVFSPDVLCQDEGTATATAINGSTATPTSTPAEIEMSTGTPTSTPAEISTATATATPAFTATPPPTTGSDLCEGLITDLNAYPMSPLAKPALGEAVIDPQFGTTIRRITDIESTVTGEQAVIKPMYSTVQAWNADESYLILYQRSEGHQLFTGDTYQFIRTLDITPPDIEEVFWHFTDPDSLFYVEPYYVNEENPGQRLIRYRVSTDTKEVVRSFADICSINENVVGGGDIQMMSWDSDVIGLRCVNEPAKFFGYRISTDTVTPIITSGEGNNYQPWYAPQAAPSGNLFLLDFDVLDSNLNFVRRLDMDSVEHSSLGKFSNGNDGLFTVAFAEAPSGGCGPGSLIAHDLTDGNCRTVVGEENAYPYPPSDTHISALAHLRPGWVAISGIGVANSGETDQAGQEVLDNELLLVNTEPGGEICRVGHHRAFGDGGPHGYWSEPHVVISPSGTRLLFGSDWEGGPSVDTYVVELPSYGDNPLPTPIPSSTPTALEIDLFLPLVVND